MPEPRSPDLHGSAPDDSPVVLLLIDFINDMEFEGGDALLEHALLAARCTAELKRRAAAANVPSVYVNDNFGRWQSDFRKLLDHVLGANVRGKPVAELLRPDERDYFVLKPKHSGFFNTTLDLLLEHLHARTLVITGVTADICVMFTAADAHMRDFRLVIPPDCVASANPRDAADALRLMERNLHAQVAPSSTIDFGALARSANGDA
jgi:nicotinamidase-related amidase